MNKEENPLVSIIIPVYNGSNYMKEAIDSALNQTYSNVEVIVVNDGSTDDGVTEKIALSYGSTIKYLCKENGGVSSAVNLGIRSMRGEYFAWLSHDDIYYPNKIQMQIDAIHKVGDQRAIVHSNYDLLDEETGTLTQINWLTQYSLERITNSNFAPVFLCIHGCSILIHRSHFERVGLYDEGLIATQDSVFLFHVMRGQRSIFLQEPLLIGRIHKEQGSQTLKCHELEYNLMMKSFCEMLTDKEKTVMCGSVYNFYYRLYQVLRYSQKASSILPYLLEKITYMQPPKEDYYGKKSLDQIFKNLSLNNATKIVLFGAGDYGKRLLKDLKSRDFLVDAIIDNDKSKHGTYIEGVICQPFSYLYMNKEQMLVIISMYYENDVLKQLKAAEIPYIISYREIYNILFDYLPILLEF